MSSSYGHWLKRSRDGARFFLLDPRYCRMYKYRGHAHAHHTRSSRKAGQDPKEDLKNWPKGRIAWTNRLRMSFGLGPIVVMPMSMLPPVLPAVLPPVTAILPGELHQARVLTAADLLNEGPWRLAGTILAGGCHCKQQPTPPDHDSSQ